MRDGPGSHQAQALQSFSAPGWMCSGASGGARSKAEGRIHGRRVTNTVVVSLAMILTLDLSHWTPILLSTYCVPRASPLSWSLRDPPAHRGKCPVSGSHPSSPLWLSACAGKCREVNTLTHSLCPTSPLGHGILYSLKAQLNALEYFNPAWWIPGNWCWRPNKQINKKLLSPCWYWAMVLTFSPKIKGSVGPLTLQSSSGPSSPGIHAFVGFFGFFFKVLI